MKTYGPYLRKDGRKHVIHIYDDGTRRTQSYPRYLLEQHLQRELLEIETVDHVDEDFTNDSIQNLQILSRGMNAEKSAPKAEYLELICKVCSASFLRRKAVHLYETQVRHKDGPFCSHQCVGKMYH